MERKNALVGKLLLSLGKRVLDHERRSKLCKHSRIRYHNGRVIDVFLLALSNETASVSIIDTLTQVEVSTMDINDKDLQLLNLTYKEASEIYDEILDGSKIAKEMKKENEL